MGAPTEDRDHAERFVAQHGEDVRYVYAFRSWFVWNGQRWWRDPGDAIARLAARLETARQDPTVGTIEKIARALRIKMAHLFR